MKAHPAEEPNEWTRRSEYDIDTADAMLKAGPGNIYGYIIAAGRKIA